MAFDVDQTVHSLEDYSLEVIDAKDSKSVRSSSEKLRACALSIPKEQLASVQDKLIEAGSWWCGPPRPSRGVLDELVQWALKLGDDEASNQLIVPMLTLNTGKDGKLQSVNIEAGMNDTYAQRSTVRVTMPGL